MKYLFRTFLTLSLLSQISFANDAVVDHELNGSWETTVTGEDGRVTKFVAIVSGGYTSIVRFMPADNKFLGTSGGSITSDGSTISITYEYYVSDSSRVGTTEKLQYSIIGNTMQVEGFNTKWTRLDNGAPGELAEAWIITGRERNGEMTTRKPGVRRTMKILSGTRFQWIAYNVATKQFMGTGGGTYTTKDGKYTENIDFFSRDSTRVGAKLEFDFEVKGQDWHHKGLSSKGEPIYEVWSPRSMIKG